jgi:hypothetical protein
VKEFGSFQCAGPAKRRSIFMKAKELDEKFDAGDDVTEFLDLSKSRRPGQEQKRVNVDFPVWMIHSLDREARRLGVPRQSIIKIWIAERLQKDS